MPNTLNSFTRGLKRLGKILGVSFPEDNPELDQLKDINLTLHTPTEMRYLPGIYSPDGSRTEQLPSTAEFFEQLLGISQQAGNWSRTAQSLNILAPELKDAADIWVSSVLSPTDMQTNSVQITLEKTDLGEEIEDKISSQMTEFFNSEFDLAPKLRDWMKQAIFRDGATPILIVPQVNIDTLNAAVDIDEVEAGHDLKTIIKNANHPKPLNQMLTPGSYTAGESYYDHAPFEYDAKDASMELLIPTIRPTETRKQKHYDALLSHIDEEIDATFEQWKIQDKSYEAFFNPEVVSTTKEVKKAIKDLFSEARKSVVISHDATKISTGAHYSQSVKSMEKKIMDHFIMDTANPMYLLDVDDKLEDKHHPAVVVLPYQAVVPVTIPGAPDKHIGYFVLVNEWGAPLTDHVYDGSTYNGPRKLTEGAMQATFGQPAAYKYAAGINDDQRFKATTMMFGLTIRNLLNNKLEEYGFKGATVEEHEATTLCLFRYLLARKKVGIVFVPPSMLVYMAYDYHLDGTGKSRIEDLSTLLSLRTVLLISGVMAATENAIDHKVLEVDVDEKNANVVQHLAMIRDAFIEKKMLRFDNEPLTVQRDLLQRSLTILPKNVRGLKDGLNVNTQHNQTQAVSPDTQFMDQLTDWIITGLEIPHSAFNKTSENEYARSIAATNLMFSTKIKSEQKTTAKMVNKLIRTYLKYSVPLQELILEVLKTSSKSRKDLRMSNEAAGDDIDAAFDDADENVDPKKRKRQNDEDEDQNTDTPDDTNADARTDDAPADDTNADTPDDTSSTDTPEEEEAEEIEPVKPQKSKEKIDMNKDSIKEQMATVIRNISIQFPTPQMAIDKAQLEEINAYMGSIDQVLQAVFSDNQVFDQEARDMFTLIRETVKADMVRDFIKQIGFQSSYDIPFPKDIDLKNSFDLYNYISNQKLKFENFKKYVVDVAHKHIAEGGDMGGGMGGDMGGGYGGGMGGDMGGGVGGDMGGGMGGADEFGGSDTGMGGGEMGGGAPEEGGAPGAGGSTNPEDMNFDNTPPPPSF